MGSPEFRPAATKTRGGAHWRWRSGAPSTAPRPPGGSPRSCASSGAGGRPRETLERGRHRAPAVTVALLNGHDESGHGRGRNLRGNDGEAHPSTMEGTSKWGKAWTEPIPARSSSAAGAKRRRRRRLKGTRAHDPLLLGEEDHGEHSGHLCLARRR